MRTVVGSRGSWAVDLLFRGSWEERQSHNRLRIDDRRRGHTLIPVTVASPYKVGSEISLSTGGTRPPAIHSRTRRMKSCSISTTTARRGGAAQSVAGHDRP